MKQARKARALRRCIQTGSLALFLYLLLVTVWPLAATWLPQDFFLRMDPLAATLVPVTVRAWTDTLLPGVAVIISAVVFGRIFCGYICPMGVTLDAANWLLGKLFGRPDTARRVSLSPRWRQAKYLILGAVSVGAILGVNVFFWGSPIALVTRFYALLVHPLLLLAGFFTLSTGQSVFAALDFPGLAYATLTPRRFETIGFVLVFFILLFALERVRPRFWCRYLCPAGAIMALVSLRPLWRRGTASCSGCDACVKQCPTGAILPKGLDCRHAECITCRACEDVCPVAGVTFSFRKTVEKQTEGTPTDRRAFLPSRRAFLGAAGAGTLLAGVQYSGGRNLLVPGGLGNPRPSDLVRPPGAVPEPDFLDRCIRCGQCMKVCPTNGLQPVWFLSGVEGMFSPVLLARRGPCEPGCNACGRVCPTGAITALALEEKQWAKIGTATVLQHRCLAWAESRRCMVCQEVCPFGSVRIVHRDGQAVPVPVVDAMRCFGCGYCEYHCPTAAPAIRVESLSALRLGDAKYKQTAERLGYILEPGTHGHIQDDVDDGELPPGFTP